MDEVIKIQNALIAIQDKHLNFFIKENKSIIEYFDINWDPPSITYHSGFSLPPEIVNDIDALFS